MNKKVIVIGYIHECETLNNMTIPAEIRKLCYLFYAYCRKKIFLSPPTAFHNMSKKEKSFRIFDIISKKMSNATVHENDTKYFDDYKFKQDTFCYIPQIDYLEKKYDAILTQFTMEKPASTYSFYDHAQNHLCLMLFESDNIDNEMIKYNLLVDVQKIKHQSVHQFLYCGPKYGVIYEQKQAQLFQLQTSQISSFDFNPIQNCNTDIFLSKDTYGNTVKWLNMCYISNLEQIFAISCGKAYRNICYRGNPSMAPNPMRYRCNTEAKCGIYDFKNNMWKQVEPIKFNSLIHIKDHFRCISCSDKYGENIYVLPDKAQSSLNTIKYDMHENKWIEVDHGRSVILSTHSSSIWIDNDNPQILCYANTSYGMNVMKLDLRNKERKWMDVVKLRDHNYYCVPFV